MSKEIYIAGSAGLVGSRFCELAPKEWNLITPEYNELDITDFEALKNFFADKNLVCKIFS